MVFDIKDQAALTEVVTREVELALEKEPFLGSQIAPTFPVQDRVIKLETVEVHAFGKGQFKAPDATPALYTPKIKISEEGIELALLEEMTVIKESQWHRLESKDDSIRRAAGLDVLTRAKALQIRNERLTEWLRWQAFQGEVIIRYPNDAQTIVLNYGIPAAHKPTASIPWTSRATATPITNLRAWQKLTANAVGHMATRIHMNSDTWEELEYNEQVRAYLTDGSRDVFLPEESDIKRLLRAGTEFIIHDGGYREESAGVERGQGTITHYIPDGYVLLTTPYVIEGERIADMADGLVAVSTGYNALELRQGSQSEVMVDHATKAHMWRQASARIPRIRRPGAFVWAKVF